MFEARKPDGCGLKVKFVFLFFFHNIYKFIDKLLTSVPPKKIHVLDGVLAEDLSIGISDELQLKTYYEVHVAHTFKKK